MGLPIYVCTDAAYIHKALKSLINEFNQVYHIKTLHHKILPIFSLLLFMPENRREGGV